MTITSKRTTLLNLSTRKRSFMILRNSPTNAAHADWNSVTFFCGLTFVYLTIEHNQYTEVCDMAVCSAVSLAAVAVLAVAVSVVR